MIKAVIFDMDGLLIDSEPLWRQAAEAALLPLGIKPTDEDYHHLLGRGVKATVEYWYHKQPWKGLSKKDIEARIVEDLLAKVKRAGKLKPGAHQTLEIFKAHSLPLAIASSSSCEVIDTVIDTLAIRDFFDHLYSGAYELYGKPHPSVFFSTADLLGVKPEDCLVFEDAPAGVLAAKAAQMTCIAVPEPEVKDHKFIQIADIVIDSLTEFDEAMLVALNPSLKNYCLSGTMSG